MKSYIHIRDVSRGEIAVLDEGTVGELYHLSPDGGVEVRDVVRRSAAAWAGGSRTRSRSSTSGRARTRPTSSTRPRPRRSFGWKPEIDLDEGIAEMAAWVDANWAAIAKQPLNYQHKA